MFIRQYDYGVCLTFCIIITIFSVSMFFSFFFVASSLFVFCIFFIDYFQPFLFLFAHITPVHPHLHNLLKWVSIIVRFFVHSFIRSFATIIWKSVADLVMIVSVMPAGEKLSIMPYAVASLLQNQDKAKR